MSVQIMPFAMDKNFNLLGIIDDYSSLIWSARYYEHGDFEIALAVTQENIRLLAVGNYVMREDDENIGIVEKVEVKITETNEQQLYVSGRFLTQILSRRIVAEQTQVNGTIKAAVDKLITDAITNPDIADRKINNFVIGTYTADDLIEAQYTGKKLDGIIEDICLQYGYGYKIILNDSNEFVFTMYKGTNRSYEQDVNPYVVFSNEYDNLINAEYQKSAKNLVTAVLVAGEGEGLARKTIWVTNDENPKGLYRFEYYADSRNTSSNSGQITPQEYMRQLAESGKQDLTTYETTFGGEIDFSAVGYREDVFLGDICTIENTVLGIAFSARIIEVIESIDESGKYTIIPTFGT